MSFREVLAEIWPLPQRRNLPPGVSSSAASGWLAQCSVVGRHGAGLVPAARLKTGSASRQIVPSGGARDVVCHGGLGDSGRPGGWGWPWDLGMNRVAGGLTRLAQRRPDPTNWDDAGATPPTGDVQLLRGSGDTPGNSAALRERVSGKSCAGVPGCLPSRVPVDKNPILNVGIFS